MFSIPTPMTAGAPSAEVKQALPESRDELIEFGLLLAILRVISG